MYSGNIGLYYDLENLLKVVGKFGAGTKTADGREVVFAFVGAGSVLKILEDYVAEHHMENVVFQLALRFGSYEYHQGIPFLLFSLYIQVFFLVYGMSGNPLYDNYILYFYLFAIFIVKNSEYHFEKINLQGKAK